MRISLATLMILFCLGSEAWAQATAVAVAPLKQQEVAAGQTFIGALMPVRRSVVGSAVDGRVVEVFVEEGDPVSLVEEGDPPRRVGQPIVQLLTETISIQIDAARAELELRRQELAEKEAGSLPEEIEQAQAKLAAATALAEFGQARFQRVKSLFEQARTTSREEFEEALSASLAAEQNRIAAKAGYDLAVKGPRKEQIEQARARRQFAEEDVRRLEDMKAKYTIRAPFEGFVIAKQTEIGAWVSTGDHVAEIVQLDPIEVRIAVPESFIARIHAGDAVRVRVDASPQPVIVGSVTRIVPQADLRSRTFPIVIRLDNPKQNGDHLLKAGMLASVTLAVGQPQTANMVPKDALVLNARSTSIVVVDTDPRSKHPIARVVPVELGVAHDATIQVIDATGSLRDGQQVVVRGNERLRDGQLIEIVQVARADGK